MPKFSTERRVPFSADQMFALVADVEAYPQFLPLCESLRVLSSRERDGKRVLAAEMGVGYRAIRERFTTQVYLQPVERVIDVKYLDGPFRYLNNQWRFTPAAAGCTIHFFIDYEFKNRVLGALMGAVFDRTFRSFMEAFETRARAVYGAPQAAA